MSASTVTPASDPNSPEAKQQAQWEKEAKQTGKPIWEIIAQAKYGYMAAFMDDPELGPLLQRAADGGWTQETFQGELYKTNWWKQHAEPTRKFLLLQASDPSEANRQVNSKHANLTQLAAQQGFSISDATINNVARVSVMMGLDDATTMNMLFSQAKYGGAMPTSGIAGEHINQIKQRAADYGVTVSDARAFDWAQRMARGYYTADGVDAELRTLAKGQWSVLSTELNQGLTVKEALDPYIQQYAQLMEHGQGSVDISDPRFRNFIEGRDANGNRQLLTLEQSADKVRATSGWLQTKNAKDSVSALGEQILRTFGKVSA